MNDCRQLSVKSAIRAIAHLPQIAYHPYLMKTNHIVTTLILLGFFWVSGCNLHPAAATVYPDSTATGVSQLPPEIERTLRAIARTPTPPAPVSCQRADAPAPVRHIAVADIDYVGHTVNVQQRIHFVNNTDVDLDHLLLHVEANRWRGVFTLDRVTTGLLDELPYTLDGKRLDVTLNQVLLPGCEISILLNFRLNIPAVGELMPASKGYFGYTDRQLNLGHWLATVAVFAGGEWTSRDDSVIGEQDVLDRADWEVTVNLLNPPAGLSIAAPGVATAITPTAWRYVQREARDFSLSLSHQFIVASEAVDGVTVEVYSLPDAQENGAAAQALSVATRSLRAYTNWFGVYPSERLVVVEGDFSDGMEFSGLVFVGHHWFTQYTGDPAGYLTLITAHEVSHQWWYARIGNDSALSPWLDEALATYSEYIFLEEYYPELKDWWWTFRIGQYHPTGYVDSTVYEFDTARDYINAVYLRGAEMLRDLRQDLGPEVFFQWLADYAAAGDGIIATPDLFWSQLTPEQIELTESTREEYLRQPTVVGRG